MEEEIVQNDPDLSATQRAVTDNLSTEQVSIIDEKLMEYTCENWRKVARLVMSAMQDLRGSIKNVPDIYYGERIRSLVKEGRLKSQGNLKRMRYSEVKLP